MTRFTIPADIFARMSNAANRADDPKRPHLACVRLEYKDGKYFAIASTSYVMAVEYLGETDQPDCAVNVPLVIADADQTLIFEWYAEFKVLTCSVDEASATLTPLPDIEPLFTRWWSIFADTTQTKSKGFLYMEGDMMAALCAASPSGKLCFPAVVDSSRVVIVRDVYDPNWVGAFLANDKTKTAKPAVKPEWMI
jgi:hypothetical protein